MKEFVSISIGIYELAVDPRLIPVSLINSSDDVKGGESGMPKKPFCAQNPKWYIVIAPRCFGLQNHNKKRQTGQK